MTITYETEINGKHRKISDPDLVDIMIVRGLLRYADKDGNQGKFDSGSIIGAKGGDWKVILRTPSGREEYNFVNHVKTDGDIVYLAADGTVRNFEDSHIARIRSLKH